MAKWVFICNDNGGRYQSYIVKADNKPEAIKKAFIMARNKAAGDIITWSCKLKQVY